MDKTNLVHWKINKIHLNFLALQKISQKRMTKITMWNIKFLVSKMVHLKLRACKYLWINLQKLEYKIKKQAKA